MNDAWQSILRRQIVNEEGKIILSKPLRWLLLAALTFAAGGCGIGPPMLRRDRFDYQVALSESWKRQMLLNLVKMRYADAPVFLEVTSIINQHSIQGQVSALGVLNGPQWSYSQEYGGWVTAYDRPTVTSSPLTGQKFARQLMSPIEPATILSMVQSGWPVDFVLRLTCESVNGVRNASRSALARHQADPEFEELLAALRRIQVSDAIGMRSQRKGNLQVVKVFLGRQAVKEIEADRARARKILGVDPNTQELQLVYGAVPAKPNELSILSRSMLQIMVELGGCVDVPQEHLKKGKAAPVTKDIGGEELMRIHSGRKAPSDAAVAIPYKGRWFWVADDDLASKRMLAALMMFFSLTETGSGVGAPVVTIPAG